jgi:4-hydroxy-2-oxoheptanedioate aldolase
LRTVKEAEDLVQAAKFPPVGKRGFGSPYSAKQFGPTITGLEYLNGANENTLTMVQIETKEALEAVDEIAAVKGVDVLFVGPFDLGEIIPNIEHERFRLLTTNGKP